MINKLKAQLDLRQDLQKYLFIRGFLITTKNILDINTFPFYGNWNKEKVGNYFFLTHKLTKVYHYIKDELTFFLVGHSYNPFTMKYDEVEELKDIADAYCEGKESFQKALDELTGVFVIGWFSDKQFTFTTDPSGLQSAYYGIVEDDFMITSHPQLTGDLYGLSMDPFVKKLINYKWYPRILGAYLPCDLSPYKEIKRVVPNVYFTFSNNGITSKRFYPLKELSECINVQEYQDVIKQAADILKHNAELISKKWKKPAISLTGGMDSTTTFAAANGFYDKYETFSYVSAPKEIVDANAAKKISDHFSVKHTLFEIPDDSYALEDYEIKADILDHNSGYISLRRGNELRKRIYLEKTVDFDVEAKSWGSETIRCRWHKHFERDSMPPLSGKLFRNIYKIFISNRILANKIDRLFEKYIHDYEYTKIPAQYPASDMFYAEIALGSWGGPNVSEMKYYSDITIPCNNRMFFDLLFKIPVKQRIHDEHLLSIKEILNKELYDMNILVVNATKSKTKSKFFNLIFSINQKLPF